MCTFMLDRDARNKLANFIRSLASGSITNDEFKDALPTSHLATTDTVYVHSGDRKHTESKKNRGLN